LQGDLGTTSRLTCQKSCAICGSSREFWHAAAPAWQNPDGCRDQKDAAGRARSRDSGRATTATDSSACLRNPAVQEEVRAATATRPEWASAEGHLRRPLVTESRSAARGLGESHGERRHHRRVDLAQSAAVGVDDP
jgi:hypothetical protein